MAESTNKVSENHPENVKKTETAPKNIKKNIKKKHQKSSKNHQKNKVEKRDPKRTPRTSDLRRDGIERRPPPPSDSLLPALPDGPTERKGAASALSVT